MIFIIIGNTCAGKSTFMNYVLNEYRLAPIKQYTTRKKRNEGDQEYVFVSPSEMKKTEFVHLKKYNGNLYGVAKESLDAADTESKILITDYATARAIKKEYQAEIIYLCTPLTVRLKRICSRGNGRNKKRIFLDFFYSWEIFFADKVIYNNKTILNLEGKARDYFDKKMEHTKNTDLCEGRG